MWSWILRILFHITVQKFTLESKGCWREGVTERGNIDYLNISGQPDNNI